MIIRDREQAAHLLGRRLAAYRGKSPLVLGIPRGAVPMASIIAEALHGELDVVLVHKLGAPGNPELAIGAIDEAGHVYLEPRVRQIPGLAEYIDREGQAQLGVLMRRRALYTPIRPAIDPEGRVVIIVDDGIATGSTMIAALRAVRARRPARLIVAAGVASRDVARRLREEADEVVCLIEPKALLSIGQFFEDFGQVSDEEVVATLARACAGASARRGA